MAKKLTTTIQVNFVLIPSEARIFPLKNSLAVKKGVALFKNGQREKSCEIKGAAKKWL